MSRPKRNRARRRAAEAIEKSRRALVLTHVRPDGDAVGSVIALTAILRAMGRAAVPRSAQPVPRHYGGLAGASWIRGPGPGSRLPAVDTVVVLDSATLERTGFAESLPAGANIVNIDHHVSNSGFGDVAWVDPSASSTGEMLLSVALEKGWPLPPAARDGLYAAIYTDTGRFSYSNTTPGALELASELVRRGTDAGRLYRMIYCSRLRGSLDLEAAARASLEVAAGGRVASIALSEQDFRRCRSTPLDAEEFPQIPMQLEGVEAGVFVYSLPSGHTKVSLRSTGSIDVSRLAKRFGGGGHKRAAGCELALPLQKARRRIVAAVKSELRRR